MNANRKNNNPAIKLSLKLALKCVKKVVNMPVCFPSFQSRMTANIAAVAGNKVNSGKENKSQSKFSKKKLVKDSNKA